MFFFGSEDYPSVYPKLSNAKAPSEWAVRLAERRPANVATVALANKTARTIWALLAHDRVYQANFVSQAA